MSSAFSIYFNLAFAIFSPIVIHSQISKQEIIKEVNSIEDQSNPSREIIEAFQPGHSTIESEIFTVDKSVNDKTTEIVALSYYYRFYPDNYYKTVIYFKKNIPIAVLKEKKITLTSAHDEGVSKILTSSVKYYVYNWEEWKYEKEIIKDGGLLLENNIDKKEIEDIILKNKE
ncbi:hypothetical protein QE422_001951 [Chryseobacterium sp. SORGH_AS 447]|uniref:hypothetical protein n=1 Tax=Chryseobacterium sp. SORGH_AS_0447 TaxID=3041769 RepID=UPI0027822F41|nr:hypothetical protein [Chryseobacterium sp. SORGH_AS_0447]MDQ1161583.1 hypothetical protein [Chryseobacterium sp. SORGH_AS_0447]